MQDTLRVLLAKQGEARRKADIIWAEAMAAQKSLASFHYMVRDMESNVADLMKKWKDANEELNNINYDLYPYQVEAEIRIDEHMRAMEPSIYQRDQPREDED